MAIDPSDITFEDNGSKGRYVYRLVVREAKGQVIKLTVDAKAPF